MVFVTFLYDSLNIKPLDFSVTVFTYVAIEVTFKTFRRKLAFENHSRVKYKFS